MRDYRYIWNSPQERRLVCSGIEIKDFATPEMAPGGLVLLEHKVDEYFPGPFPMACTGDLPPLLNSDPYTWGDIAWTEFTGSGPPALSDLAISRLLFFAKMRRPLDGVRVPELNNRYLACGHDDGWYLSIHYDVWDDIVQLLSAGAICSAEHLNQIRYSPSALWIQGENAGTEEKTEDIDRILNRRAATGDRGEAGVSG